MPSNSLLAASFLPLALATACSSSGPKGSGQNGGDGEATTSSGASATGTSAGGASSGGATTGTAGTSGDERAFVPERVTASKLEGAGEDMSLLAFTLQQGLDGAQLFLAVRNDGAALACDANITVEFFDADEQSLAAWTGGLYVAQLYSRSDDPSSVLGCLGPAEVGMAGTTELPEAVRSSDVATLVYRFSYFAGDVLPFDLVPIDALRITGVEVFATAIGSGFRGAFENGLDVPVEGPTVTIFPTNAVGRPLDIAEASEQIEIPAGERWEFETSVVNDPGVAHAVFAGASPVLQ